MPIAIENTLLYGLHRAAQTLEAETSDRLAGLGLTPRQAIVLMAIAEAGHANQRMFVEKTGVDRSTIGTIFARLQKRKLVRRPRSMIDSRARIVALTHEGEQVEREARAIVEVVEAEARARIGKDQPALGSALRALAAARVAAG